MNEYERELVFAEIERLGRAMTRLSGPPLYFDAMSQPTPGAELLLTHDDELTHDDLRAAKAELAEKHYVGFGHVEDMARQATDRAGLGFSVPEQVQVIKQVKLTLERGRPEVSDEQVLELSRYAGSVIGLASAIPDAEHLQAAAVLARSGLGGHTAAAVAKRARELGVPDPLGSRTVTASPDTMALALAMAGDDDGGTAALAQTRESRARSAHAADSDDADSVVARHPEFAHLFKPGRVPGGARHPAKSGKTVTSKTRAHKPDEDTHDPDQPGRGGDVHEKLRAIIERNPDLLTDGKGRTVPEVNHQSYPRKPASRREREQRRAEGGKGGRGGRSIPDLHPGHAPGHRESGSIRA